MVIADVVPSTAATTSGHKVIGAKPAQPIKDGRSVGVEDLESAFARYRVPLLRKVAGDLVTLNLRALFSGTDA